MTLARFEAAAREHFAHPPATWQVRKNGARNWQIVTGSGAVLDRFDTQRQAHEELQHGHAPAMWHDRTDWYLGYSRDARSRELTEPERAVIADIVGMVNSHRATFRDLTPRQCQRVRVIDRDECDHTEFEAVQGPDERWRLRDVYWWTYATDELEFLDRPATCASGNPR